MECAINRFHLLLHEYSNKTLLYIAEGEGSNQNEKLFEATKSGMVGGKRKVEVA